MFQWTVGRTILNVDAVQRVFSCSTGDVASGAAINGSIVDRLGLGVTTGGNVLNQAEYCELAEPFCLAWSTYGTTAANQLVSVQVKLQHGDSSGGGDMADYYPAGGTCSTSPSSGETSYLSPLRNYFTTAQTSDFRNWTTGAMKYSNNPFSISLEYAKRFIRSVGYVTKTFGATATAAATTDQLNAVLGIRFGGFSADPPSLGTSSSSTST